MVKLSVAPNNQHHNVKNEPTLDVPNRDLSEKLVKNTGDKKC